MELDVAEPRRAVVALAHETEGDAASLAGPGRDRERAIGHVHAAVRHVIVTGEAERDGIGAGHDGQVGDVGHGVSLLVTGIVGLVVGAGRNRGRQAQTARAAAMIGVAMAKARSAVAMAGRSLALLDTMISGVSGVPSAAA